IFRFLRGGGGFGGVNGGQEVAAGFGGAGCAVVELHLVRKLRSRVSERDGQACGGKFDVEQEWRQCLERTENQTCGAVALGVGGLRVGGEADDKVAAAVLRLDGCELPA